MDIRFANTWVLYLLWLIPALGLWWYLRQRRRASRRERFLSARMNDRLFTGRASTRFYWQWALVLGGATLALIALARPQWGTRELIVQQKGRNLIIALDVSRSMLATDVYPNRLRRAVVDVIDLVQSLRGDRVGLIAFRGKAESLCPLTSDYAFFRTVLEGVDITSAPRGRTDIGSAITLAVEALASDVSGHQAVILISDGDDLAGRVEAAVEEAKAKGVTIFTIGLGDPRGSRIPLPDADGDFLRRDGNDVITKLHHQTLSMIAEQTGGAYIPVATRSMDLGRLYAAHLSRITRAEYAETTRQQHVERYQLFLLGAILCIGAAGALSRGRLLRRSAAALTARAATAAALAWLTLAVRPGDVHATNSPAVAAGDDARGVAEPDAEPAGRGHAAARKAQALFNRGEFAAAGEAYLNAAAGAVGQTAYDFQYNAVIAFSHGDDHGRATEVARQLDTKDNKRFAEGAYVRGVAAALKAAQESQNPTTDVASVARSLDEAGEAFRLATRERPEDDNSRHNLTVTAAHLTGAREQAKIAALMERYKDKDAFAVVNEILTGQRAIAAAQSRVMRDTTPERIYRFESQAARQRHQLDAMIPLRAKLEDAPAPPDADLGGYLQSIDDQMRSSMTRLRDLDERGFDDARSSADGVYGLWKGMAPYGALIGEGIRWQTNAVAATEALASRDRPLLRQRASEQQQEVGQLTDLFVERFSQAVPEEGTRPPPAPPGNDAEGDAGEDADEETEAEGLSAEERQEILDLAAQAKAEQEAAERALTANGSVAAAVEHERESLRLLEEIRERLPKEKSQSQQAGQPPPQPPPEQPEPNEPEDDGSPPEPDEPPNQPDEPEEELAAAEPQPLDLSEEEVEAILKKALQKEQEKQAEKRKLRHASSTLDPDDY